MANLFIQRQFELFFIETFKEKKKALRLEQATVLFNLKSAEEIEEDEIKRGLNTYCILENSQLGSGLQHEERGFIYVWGLRKWFEKKEGLNYILPQYKSVIQYYQVGERVIQICTKKLSSFGMSVCRDCGKLLSYDTIHCTSCNSVQVHHISEKKRSKVH